MNKTDKLFILAGFAHDENSWRETTDYFLKHKLEVSDLVKHIDEIAPYTEDDWTVRAEFFETAMYIMSAVREREKGNF